MWSTMFFLYGFVGGAMSCLLFFLMLFRKVEELTSNTVRSKALKHLEYIAVAKEAAMVAPAKVETLCRMVCFDDDIVGSAIQCRAVYFSNTITFYKVDQLTTLPDHRQKVVAEKVLCKVNSRCVMAKGQRISKYHRHVNTNTRYAPVKGKCTVLRSRDGMPLFLYDPTAALAAELAQAKKERREAALRAQRERMGLSTDGEDEEASTSDLTRGGDDSLLASDKECDGSREQSGKDGKRRRTRRKKGSSRSGRNESVKVQEAPMSEWRCIAIKFPTRRENERWFNLFQNTAQSEQWRTFLKHLPQVDVFNLLLARLFFENTRSTGLQDLLKCKFQDKLDIVSRSLPKNLKGNIYLDTLTIGGEIPLISNVSDPSISATGELDFDFDILYRGGLFMSIRFALVYRDVHVPDIVFNIRVLELAGRMHFNVGPPPTEKFWLGTPKPPELRLEVTQEVGSKEGLLNVVMKALPDMSNFVTNIVRVKFFDDMVLPDMDDFPWPVFHNSSKKKKPPTTTTPSSSSAARQASLTMPTFSESSIMHPAKDDNPFFMPSIGSGSIQRSDSSVATNSNHNNNDNTTNSKKVQAALRSPKGGPTNLDGSSNSEYPNSPPVVPQRRATTSIYTGEDGAELKQQQRKQSTSLSVSLSSLPPPPPSSLSSHAAARMQELARGRDTTSNSITSQSGTAATRTDTQGRASVENKKKITFGNFVAVPSSASRATTGGTTPSSNPDKSRSVFEYQSTQPNENSSRIVISAPYVMSSEPVSSFAVKRTTPSPRPLSHVITTTNTSTNSVTVKQRSTISSVSGGVAAAAVAGGATSRAAGSLFPLSPSPSPSPPDTVTVVDVLAFDETTSKFSSTGGGTLQRGGEPKFVSGGSASVSTRRT